MSLQGPKAWGSWTFSGLLLGLALGLVVSWGIWPLQYYDTEPTALRPDQKAAYIVLTGLAYGVDKDLDRARVRLYLLQDPAIVARVADMANEYIKHGNDPQAALGLAMLAQALGAASSTMASYLATPTPSPSPQPTMTQTLLPPTPTASWTPTITLVPTPSRTATGPPTPTPTEVVPVITYTVQAGDTLYEIARVFSTTVEALVEANQLPDREVILVGQVLRIPGARRKPSPTRPGSEP